MIDCSLTRRAALGACLALPGVAVAQASALPPIPLALIEGLSGPFANTGEAVVRNLSGCFFVPDTATALCYFGWIDSKTFAAPLKNGAREVAALTFFTRAA